MPVGETPCAVIWPNLCRSWRSQEFGRLTDLSAFFFGETLILVFLASKKTFYALNLIEIFRVIIIIFL